VFKLHGIKVDSIYNQSGGEGVVKIFSLLFISIFICSSFSPLFANNKRDSEITVEESIKEILDSVNEIITSGIKAAEKELKEIQKALKEKTSKNTCGTKETRKGSERRSGRRKRVFKRETRAI
jgi:ElaB/YqjD/DUF883 family membrane-anchored ribosome-binding protein